MIKLEIQVVKKELAGVNANKQEPKQQSKPKDIKAQASAIAMMSYAGYMAIDQIKKEFSYEFTNIGFKNGDSNLQALANRKLEQFTDGLNFFENIAGGAVMGSGLGPIGAAVGAVAGATNAGLALYRRDAERERNLQHILFAENNSQAYQLATNNFSATTNRMR